MMKKIKSFKYKGNGDLNISGTGGGVGILNKLQKRYSNVKFLRNSPGRQASPQPVSTGSYDMNGHDSEDLKREIGAPILISKTRIDDDSTDCCIRPENGDLRSVDHKPNNGVLDDREKSNSSEEINIPSVVTNFGDIKFSFHSPKLERRLIEDLQNDPPNDINDLPKKHGDSVLLRKNRSKSATNLHKSELKVVLQKAPSLELEHNNNNSIVNISDTFYDVPRRLLNEKTTAVKTSTETITATQQNLLNTSKQSASSSANNVSSRYTSSDNFSTIYSSKNSLNKNTSLGKYNNDDPQRKRKGSDSSCADDFDLKSASFQSLDARNLFLSIEELNEITKQINESDDLNHEVDLEYCEHRDKLKPDQRRITLMRNKNGRAINFENKKEKLTNAWSGLKHWIGEEKGKIKEVMQKHAAQQRVGQPLGAGGNNIVRNQDFFDNIKAGRGGRFSQRNSMYIDETSQTVAETNTAASTSTNQSQMLQQKLNENESDHDNSSLKRNGDGEPKLNELNDSDRSRTQSRVYSSEERDVPPGVPAFIQSLVRKGSKTPSTTKGSDGWEGQNGFEELRRYVKQGGDFGKDLVAILQERVDSEQLYAKSLSKMASKLNKACREIPGSLADAWRGVATEMESRSEVHRLFSNSMVEEIVKPLKVILDNQHKTRKAIESTVDKSARILAEWRASEAKAKKSSHSAARENEKLQDAMLDVRIQRSPSVAMLHHQNNHKSPDKEIKSAEKDCAKLDNKRRKAEESVKRADVEYYTHCIRAERARVEWEMSVLRGSTILQNHENQRLASLKKYLTDYLKFTNQMSPSMNQIVEHLAPHINACNVQKDLNVVKNIRRASEGPSEQLLPDFYCEHTTLAMNRERRKHALVKLLQLVRTDLDRERKSRNGLKEISQSLNTGDNQNITDKLYHIRSMLTYLEGARFKLQSALLELDHKPRGSHPLAPHIQITRDRTGLQQSILKVPLWLRTGDETDQLNQEFSDADLNNMLELNENCVDSRNDVLIKHFDRKFNRSKSSVDFTGKHSAKDIVVLTGGGGGGDSAGGSSGGSTNGEKRNSSSPVFDRGIADGGSNQPDSDFDEFSSQDEDDDVTTTISKKQQNGPGRLSAVAPAVISRCRALYSYSPKLYDELELNPGDLIEVHAKQDDGWWLGALKNKIGIFPATYVEEVNQ